VLLLEPQPQKTNEMNARQKRLGTAFNGDIVRRKLRPARRGKDWEAPTQILDFSSLTTAQKVPAKRSRERNLRRRQVRLLLRTRGMELYSICLADGSPLSIHFITW
jgi:hypothetical protein